MLRDQLSEPPCLQVIFKSKPVKQKHRCTSQRIKIHHNYAKHGLCTGSVIYRYFQHGITGAMEGGGNSDLPLLDDTCKAYGLDI